MVTAIDRSCIFGNFFIRRYVTCCRQLTVISLAWNNEVTDFKAPGVVEILIDL